MRDRAAALRRRMEGLPLVVVDMVIAVLAYLATVALPLKVFRDGGWPLFVLAGLASLPLVARRRHPILTTAIVGAGTLGLAVVGTLGEIPLPYGQLVATYTVASLAAPVWRLVVMAATAAGTVLSVLVLLGQGPATLGLAGLPFAVAYALGVGVRARRDRIAMLEERTRRLAEAHEVAAARERERIAREIHDIVAHSVSLMVVQAEAGIVQAAGAATTATFETISGTGRDALGQLDRALGVLRGDDPTRQPAPGLDGLPALLDGARVAGLDAELTETGLPRPVPADLGAATYRIVQEAITNTVKHADARRLRVGLDWRPDELRVEVADDGAGAAARPATNGHGLLGMRERVHAFGGELRTGPRDDGPGFGVTAVLPLKGSSGG